MASDLTVETERAWLDLSLAQQAVWLDAKLSGSSEYQLGAWARIDAPLDEHALRQAVSLTMARHDGLRIRVDDELPRQWLDQSVEPPMAISDLALDGRDPDSAFQAHIGDVFATAMPLGDHPLFNVAVLRAGKNLSFILCRFHHLIADSFSVVIALQHWLNAYEALMSGSVQELAPESSYLKVISADAAYLESAAYHKDLAYWSNRFDPMPPALIADMEVRPKNQRDVPTAEWIFGAEEFADFQGAAKGAGASVQRALFALFASTLGRRYGQTDVVAGIALHRRDLTNRHALGMLAGVMATRCHFEAHWTLEECVQAFSEKVDRDLRHQRLPIDTLSRSLGLAGTGRAGLFEAALSYIPADRGARTTAVGEPLITIGQVNTKEASPISLHATELASGEGLSVRLAVNTDYLDAAEAPALLALLQAACRAFSGEPETRFEDLATLTEQENSLVVHSWNQTSVPLKTGTLDGLFAEQALCTPEAIAIVGRDGSELSYAELDAQSTRLARGLVAHGLKPDDVVAVRLERSTETIITLLAILKAGGVYLPLDPAQPAERLEYMAKDAGAALVLASIDGLDAEAELPKLSDARRFGLHHLHFRHHGDA